MEKETLIERIEKSHAILETALAEFHEPVTNASGTWKHWSLKDTVAHMNAWEKNFTDWLAPTLGGVVVQGGPRFDSDEYEADNAAIFEENHDRTWDDILEESRRLPALMVRILRALPEEDLDDPARFARPVPLRKRLENHYVWHVQAHVAQMFAARNASERGIKYAEEFAALVKDDAPSEERGTAIYNLACLYALAGHPDKAISAIAQAFELNPTLVEWSRQDTDLDSLRERDDFKALYKDAA